MIEIMKTSEATFQQQVLQAARPVWVDFTATWCQPCKQLEPLVKELAEEWGSMLTVMKRDVEDSPQIAMDYQVRGGPTLILFKDGKAVERVTGYQPKDRLQRKFSPHLS